MTIDYVNFDYLTENIRDSRMLAMLKSNAINAVEEIAKNPNAKERSDQNTMFFILLKIATYADLTLFNKVYQCMIEDGTEFTKEIYEKLFNVACCSESFESFKTLDKRFNLSSMMMTNDAFINEERLINAMPDMSGISGGEPIEKKLKFSGSKHGFVTASTWGNNELVNYLLSVPTVTDVPVKLLEAGFISASKLRKFETALIIYPRIGNIMKSSLINEYMRNTKIEEIKSFIYKLMVEDLDNDLPVKEIVEKKTKI